MEDLRLIEKLRLQDEMFYEATNGVRIVLAADRNSVWISAPGTHWINDDEMDEAIAEFLAK